MYISNFNLPADILDHLRRVNRAILAETPQLPYFGGLTMTMHLDQLNTVPAARVSELLEHLGGTIFRVTFIKKDGSLRNMACRLHVRKGVKGNGRSPAADLNNPYVTVFAMAGSKSGFRSVNLNTLMEVKTHGCTIAVS